MSCSQSVTDKDTKWIQSQCPSWETEDSSNGHLAQGLHSFILLLIIFSCSLLWKLQRRTSRSLKVNDLLGQSLGKTLLEIYWIGNQSFDFFFFFVICILCFGGEMWSGGDRRWSKSFPVLGVCHKQIFHITSLLYRYIYWFVSSIHSFYIVKVTLLSHQLCQINEYFWDLNIAPPSLSCVFPWDRFRSIEITCLIFW